MTFEPDTGLVVNTMRGTVHRPGCDVVTRTNARSGPWLAPWKGVAMKDDDKACGYCKPDLDAARARVAGGHQCSLPACDGTELGHDLARDFPDQTRAIDEAFDRLRRPEDYVMPENLHADQPPGFPGDGNPWLPAAGEAATRILAFVGYFGDGRVDSGDYDEDMARAPDHPPLFARDLEAVAKAALPDRTLSATNRQWAIRWPDGRIGGWVNSEKVARNTCPTDGEVLTRTEETYRTAWVKA